MYLAMVISFGNVILKVSPHLPKTLTPRYFFEFTEGAGYSSLIEMPPSCLVVFLNLRLD